MADGSLVRIPEQQSNEHIALLKSRYDDLKGSTERSQFESHWQDAAELMAPRKLDFVGMRTPGEKRMTKVYDSTGIHANELLAAGLHGMATNPASKWFSLRLVGAKIQNEDGSVTDLSEVPAVQKYLAHVEDIMWSRIYQPGTNFTTALHEVYLDLGCFGTGAMFVGQRRDGGLLFEAVSLAEIVIAESAEGKVDTVFRKFEYTVRQMLQMEKVAGWKVSDQVRKFAEEKKFETKIMVIHAVYPREERDPTKKGPKDMPWASIYFEHEGTHLLSESGFPEFPYLVARWSKYSRETYGRGPGLTALPDVKMLQAMMLVVIKAAQKIVDPPMWLRDDGVIGQTRTIPGGINYWRGDPNAGVMLHPTDGKGLPVTLDMMEALRNRIRNTFFVDVLQFAPDADMTATEVMQRTSERMRLLGPLIGRLESELLGPMVERIFGILARMKLLPPAPDEIQEQEFTVEYVSPIATAQKQLAVQGILQTMQLMGGMLGPEAAVQVAMKKIDTEKVLTWSWDLFNCDPDLLRDDDAIDAENQKQQAMQAIQMGAPTADIMAKGAKALKDVSQANGPQGGIDVAKLLAIAGDGAQQVGPEQMGKLQEMMNGRAPPG